MPLQEFVLADTPEQLARSLALLEDLPVVGVDVERADWKRYYRAAALVQVGGEGRVALIDPLSLDDLASVDAFLADRTAVFHAMENDLQPLAALRVAPPHVEDTSIAAALLGLPTGLEGLLADLLGIVPTGDKSAMQRAEWEQRPLTGQMLEYAAGDVADLPRLWEALHDRLHAAGREHWYRQELASAVALPPAEERREWTRTKGIGRLDGAARSRAHALWAARERLARDTDTAPARILGDRVLVDLAVTPPRGTADLGRRGVRRQAVRSFGDELVAALQTGGDGDGHEPARRPLRAATDADRTAADRLRLIRAELAADLGIDAGVLCPSRTLLSAVLADPDTPERLRADLGLRPWQWEIVADPFCEALGLGPGGTPAADPDDPDEELTDG